LVKKSKPNQAADLPEPQPPASAAAAASAASEASAGSAGLEMPASQDRIPSPANPEGRFINTSLNHTAAISRRMPSEKLGVTSKEVFLSARVGENCCSQEGIKERLLNDL
jgi:hypothetical protein